MSSRFLSIVLVLLSVAAGCRGVGPAENSSLTPMAERTEPAAVLLADQTKVTSAKELEDRELALAKVLDELAEVSDLEPEAKRLLIADLREAKPENRPFILRQFKSALAFRKQLAEREQRSADEALLAMQTGKPAMQRKKLSQPQPIAETTQPQAVPVSFAVKQVQPSEEPAALQLHNKPRRVTTTNRALPLAADREPLPTTSLLPRPPQATVQQVTFTSEVQQPLSWREHLQGAIDSLQTEVQTTPGSTEEVNQHLRLRLLQLLAGNEEAALQPIPGATVSQQDYWSNQLFALSTFMDSDQQPDDKRRAAGSLMHLDQARSKLAEMATLQVRKLMFVDNVVGYGEYELHEGQKFHAGDQVMLYAEIENFTSTSTKDGYHTRLGASYEVVDRNGKRINGAQAEVEDMCRSRRQDFHMQFTVTLPTRIYPENYEIKLVITDQQSHKLGQASVPFEIVE